MNIAVAQSGGPTAAINATLAGVCRRGFVSEKISAVYGARNGIEGVLKDDLILLNDRLKEDVDLRMLSATPSAALGSCRYRLPRFEEDATPYERIREVFAAHEIGAFFYIGGNDSMDTVDKLSRYFSSIGSDIRIIGVPKTIDNDLCMTDHTPGFGSAAKFVNVTLAEIARDTDVYNTKSVMIVEIMGRHAGWLTASTCVLHKRFTEPHLIYLPETPFTLDGFLRDVREQLSKQDKVIVAVSEGVECQDETYINGGFTPGTVDAFGHQYVSGIGKFLEKAVKEQIGCKVRSVELNVSQRCASHIASRTDIDESQHIGAAAVDAALAGLTGQMMIFVRKGDDPYTVDILPISIDGIANEEKKFPPEWIVGGNNVSDEAIPYFAPLIDGEAEVFFRDGLPLHVIL